VILSLSLAVLLGSMPAPGSADAGVPSADAEANSGAVGDADAGPTPAAPATNPAAPPAAKNGPSDAAPPAVAPADSNIPSDAAPRPSEMELFGVDVGGQSVDGGVPSPNNQAARSEEMLNAKLPYETTDLAPDNPLTIGGLLYLRSQLSASANEPPDKYLLSAPFLLDTYLDARPNDRVRAFFLVRTEFDPTYDPAQASQYGITLPASPNPDFLIDQMWIKFDIARQVFVTAGRQHVKWGTAHFWFPNDLLNPVKLQPLAVFDERTGVTMLKANLPLPNQNLNIYGMGLFEGLQQANTLGTLGGAGRVEYVLSSIEAGIDMVATEGQHNRYGGDVSFGFFDFDLYAEGSVTDGRDNPLWEEITAPNFNPGPGQTFSLGTYQIYHPAGYVPSVAAGLNYSLRYGNNRILTFGGEYFYNGLGYTNPSIYPWLLLNNAATFFYLGQQYAGLYILADKPGSWYNSTFNFSTLSNLSDQTFISRIDFFQQVLTHLRFESFVDVHYGGNGEFHFSFNTPAFNFDGVSIPAINVGAPIFDVGLALRVSL
jgi:hypothetical protein